MAGRRSAAPIDPPARWRRSPGSRCCRCPSARSRARCRAARRRSGRTARTVPSDRRPGSWAPRVVDQAAATADPRAVTGARAPCPTSADPQAAVGERGRPPDGSGEPTGDRVRRAVHGLRMIERAGSRRADRWSWRSSRTTPVEPSATASSSITARPSVDRGLGCRRATPARTHGTGLHRRDRRRGPWAVSGRARSRRSARRAVVRCRGPPSSNDDVPPSTIGANRRLRC